MRFLAMLGTKMLLVAATLLGFTAVLLLGGTRGATPVAPAATGVATFSSTGAASGPATRSTSAASHGRPPVAGSAHTRAATGLAASTAAARAASAPGTSSTTRKPVFVIYYLWWSAHHWRDRLGASYPSPGAGLPATLDAGGCGTHSSYPGNTLTDVPAAGGYDQSSAATIERDVRLAAATGITGFAVNWNGSGNSSQAVSSSSSNRELQYVYDAVHKVNAEGIPFKLMLDYKASATKLSTTAIHGDLAYFTSRYGNDPATDHSYSLHPEMIWAGSWKYSVAELATVSNAFRSQLYLIGDEKPSTWNASRGAQLDGASYYWSSQNPWTNPQSFAQLRGLADAVHSGTNPDGRPKTWLAPFTPGYNAQLLYGTSTCVPRRNGQTMHALFQGNKASNPDGWTFISWNEIAEGSYIVPLTRYGQTYTNALKSVIANNG
jgi:hypothetical protein